MPKHLFHFDRRNPKTSTFSLENVLPSEIVHTYPKLVVFLKEYLKWLYEINPSTKKLSDIISLRDFEESPLLATLRKDLAITYPNSEFISDRNFLRVLPLFLESKGSSQAIEAYFKILLRAKNASIVYPKDNMLRVSDGVWNGTLGTWIGPRGKLSESRMVLQDSYYYQLYSYVIKSDLPLSKWAAGYEKALHPSGWIYFGEVELLAQAEFEYLGFTPTSVPGLLTNDLLTREINVSGDIDIPSSSTFRIMTVIPRPLTTAFSRTFFDMNIISGSETFTFNDLGNYTFNELDDNINDITIQRGAEIVLS